MIIFRPKPAQLVEGRFPGGVFTRSGPGLQEPTLGGIRASEQMIYSLTSGAGMQHHMFGEISPAWERGAFVMTHWLEDMI